MKFILPLVLLLPSCNLVNRPLPAGSLLSATSGKHVVTVDVSGKTWKEALKAIGLSVLNAGGQALANYALSEVKARLQVNPQK